MSDINGKLQEVHDNMNGFIARQESKFKEFERRLDSNEVNAARPGGGNSGGPSGLSEFKKFVIDNLDGLSKHGRVGGEVPSFLSTKSTILSTNLTSSEPSRGIAGAGRYAYKLRSLFQTIQTELPTVNVLRSNAETLNVSPQVEGDAKSESTFTFTLAPVPIQTFATFVTFSKQALSDIDAFGAFVDSTLIWALEKKAESEILSGSGSGVHLSGLTTNASAYDSTIVQATAGWNRLDVLGAAATQLAEIGYSPNFAVVSPRNWFRMRSLRASTGEYILALPMTSVGQQVYDLRILPSPAMTGDTFLVGDSSQAIIRQREKASVMLSAEHASNFTSNLVTALAEERFGLQILRPDAFVTGTLASSPA